MEVRSRLTAKRARAVLDYDPATGVFRWKKMLSARAPVGTVAGTPLAQGYIIIAVDKESYLAHRLAWLWMTGKWPKVQLDHRNRAKGDNRWKNLREANSHENNRNRPINKNNTSGFKGVSYLAHVRKWRAYVMKEHKQYHVGLFATPELADAARQEAAQILHGEFAS